MGTLALVLALGAVALFLSMWRSDAKRMERACIEAANAAYLAALEYVRKRTCPWCKLGVGVARFRNSGPWRHGAGRDGVCRASWVIDYADEYREEARKLVVPK